MATSPSTFPFFTAPHAFPSPIPTQIDPNWPPHAFHSPIPYPYPPPASAYTPVFGFSPAYSSAATYPPPPASGFLPVSSPFSPIRPPPPPSPVRTNSTAPPTSWPLPLPESTAPVVTHPFPTESSSSPAHHTSSGRPVHSPHHHHHFPLPTDHIPVQAAPCHPPSPWPPPPGATAPVQPIHPPPRFFPTPAPPSPPPPAGTPVTPQHHASSPTSITRATSSTSSQHSSVDFVLEPPPSSSPAAARATTDAPADSTAVDVDGPILTEMAFLLTERRGACGLRPRSSPATTGTTPVSATSPSEVPSAMTFVAPQVFVEMPTPNSGHIMHVIANSCLQSDSTNPTEQYLDEMPQPYGFDNLNRHTVFRADGTEHSYFALPENYPLERATPGPVFDTCLDDMVGCSTEIVDVFVCTLEQQKYEEKQQKSEQFDKCIHEPSNTAFSEQISVWKHPSEPDVHIGCSLKLNTADYTTVFSVAESSLDLHQVNNQELHRLIPQAVRMQWDPGASIPFISSKIQHLAQALQLATGIKNAIGCMQYIVSNGINPVLHATVLNMQRAAHLSQGNYLFSLYCKSVLKTEYCQMRCLWKFSIKLATRLLWDPRVFTHVLQPIFASAIKCSYAFALEWTEVKIAAVLVLVVPCSKVQVTKQRLPLEFLLMHEMLQNLSEFRDGQLTYMAQSPAPNFSELLRPMVTVLYCWLPSFENKAKLQWDPGIALPWYIYSWMEICRAGHKTVVTFSFVLLFHCHQSPKLAGIPLWLINFQVP